MRAPPHPQNAERVAALHSYDILDANRDQDLDDLVELASKLCGTTMSIINLVDADRAWIKAQVGYILGETSLETSICSHTILGDDFMEVADTWTDERTADNPLCLGDDGLRFYAGATLRTDGGLPLGALCVMDRKPMSLTDDQRHILKILARQVTARLDLHRALKTEAILRREVDHRVKNSLQLVSSLMRIQGRAASPETRAALDLAQGRLATIGSLHDLLSVAKTRDHIDLRTFIGQICTQLTASMPPNVRIGGDIATVLADARVASSLGIIINEFASNSFKHAFPMGRPGHLHISLAIPEGGVAQLICRDDGIGIDAATASDPKNQRTGLGLQIVQTMATRIDAEVQTVSGTTGTQTSVTFKPV